MPGNDGRFGAFRHPLGGDTERIQHRLAPGTAGYVEQGGARGVGHLRGVDAGQPVPNVVLGQQHLRRSSKNIRFVLACPDDLGRRESRQRGIQSQFQEPLAANRIHNPGALRSGALVIPHDARAQHAALRVQQDHAMHLSGQAQPRQFVPADAAAPQYLLNALYSSLPPVLGILLRPLGPRGRHGVLDGGALDDTAALIDEQRFGASGADIDAYEVGHACLPGVRAVAQGRSRAA